MRFRWFARVVVFACAAFLAGAVSLRPAPAGAADPPPPSLIYLPLIMSPFHTYLPLISDNAGVPPALKFLGANGGPIDGGAGTGAAPGLLAYFPTLRAKSFQWMETAGIDWFRNYGSDAIVYSWRYVEPASGQFDWSYWDELVRQVQAHHINLLASIGNSVPQWANGTGDWRQPPSDLYGQPMQNTAWYKFVYAFVQRYNGDGVNDMPGLILPIKSWEFWNEPDLREGWNPPTYPPHQFAGNVTDLVRLRAVAYAATKAADPTATVVGPATAQTTGYPSQYVGDVHGFMWSWPEFVNAGGRDTVDAISFTHYFDSNNWDVAGFDEPDFILSMVDSGRGGKPVWFTETGWNGAPAVDYQVKARDLVRLTVEMWSVPWIQHLFWYDFQEQSLLASNNHRGLIQTTTDSGANGTEPDPLFHPAYRTAELMQQILGGFTLDDHPALLNADSTRVYHFSAKGQDVWVAWWRADSGSGAVNLDTGGRTTRMISLYGQDLGLFSGGALTLGPDPIYLTTNLDWNQNVGRMTGRLHNAGQPNSFDNSVVGATVAIAGPGGLAETALTDSDGNYQFSGLPDGVYHVSVHGFATHPASYDVNVGREIYWGQTSFAVTVNP
jgi:Carboxypeptidase regulatory-like domain/Beta-galactosidase